MAWLVGALAIVSVLFGIVWACFRSSGRESRMENAALLEEELASGVERDLRDMQRAAREVV